MSEKLTGARISFNCNSYTNSRFCKYGDSKCLAIVTVAKYVTKIFMFGYYN